MTTFRQTWNLLNRKQRRTAIRLLIFIGVATLLETASTGLVIPVLSLLDRAEFVTTYPSIAAWVDVVAPTHGRLVGLAMVVLVGVFGVKAAFVALLSWWQAQFAYGTQATLSERLFSGYLHQPWAFHLQRNSAQLIRNVTTEVSMFSYVLGGSMVLLTEGLTALGIGILLFTVEPTGALILTITVGLAGWLFQRFTQARSVRWGEARQFHEGLRLQHLQQGFGSAKELKLLRREEDFVARYAEHNLGGANVAARQQTLQQVPRLWLELLAITGLAGIVLFKIYVGARLDQLLPTLGLFAAAAFRIMPSVNRVINSIQTLRYSLPVVDVLTEETSLLNETPRAADVGTLPFNVDVRLEAVSFGYPDSPRLALDDVTLRIEHGTSIGIVGESGAGKSTLVDVILGLLIPPTGKVFVDGVNIQTNLRGWHSRIGYVPQMISLTDDTLRRNIAFGVPANEINDHAINKALVAAQLDGFVRDLPLGVETVIGERGVRLSGGQRQRIGIARALYHEPSLLVLDEATSALDTATEQEVMKAVNALHGDKTILIVAHRLSTLADCDQILRLDHGKLVEVGNARQILSAAAKSIR